jgi:hypothetical protein
MILLIFPAGLVRLHCCNIAMRLAVTVTNRRMLKVRHDFFLHTDVTQIKFKNRHISIEAEVKLQFELVLFFFLHFQG